MKRATFASRLRAAREAAGLTQQEVADAIGCSRVWIARLEAGERDPMRAIESGRRQINRLAWAIGCEAGELLDADAP